MFTFILGFGFYRDFAYLTVFALDSERLERFAFHCAEEIGCHALRIFNLIFVVFVGDFLRGGRTFKHALERCLCKRADVKLHYCAHEHVKPLVRLVQFFIRAVTVVGIVQILALFVDGYIVNHRLTFFLVSETNVVAVNLVVIGVIDVLHIGNVHVAIHLEIRAACISSKHIVQVVCKVG